MFSFTDNEYFELLLRLLEDNEINFKTANQIFLEQKSELEILRKNINLNELQMNHALFIVEMAI